MFNSLDAAFVVTSSATIYVSLIVLVAFALHFFYRD